MMQQKTQQFEIKKVRKPSNKVAYLLFARSAGRCCICNELIIIDKFTQKKKIFGELAHIYAFSPLGPRAKKDKLYNNDVDNLMLVCPNCHTKIDSEELLEIYTVEQLKNFKQEHERKVFITTSVRNIEKTKVLKMIANIGREKSNISNDEIVKALIPEKLFSYDENHTTINFTNASACYNQAYWRNKQSEINEKTEGFYRDLERDQCEHIAVFAIGPIPLLIYLGYKLENKIKTILFQRHRSNENWKWEKTKAITKFKMRLRRKGDYKSNVALLLSLSGSIDCSLLPKKVQQNFFIYEIYLDSKNGPNYNFLKTKKDLQNFEDFFILKISEIKNKHKGIKTIDLFPAIPAPIAVAIGRSLNKNADPALRVYNTNKREIFKKTLIIN